MLYMRSNDESLPSCSSLSAWPMKTVTTCKGRERTADKRKTHNFTPQTANSAVTTDFARTLILQVAPNKVQLTVIRNNTVPHHNRDYNATFTDYPS